MMRAKLFGCFLIAAAAFTPAAANARAAQTPKKEYLSASEADKIRDAETPDERIRLFVSFAADRILKLKYELAHPTADRRRNERLNSLVNNYSSCLDDAADLVLLAIDKQQDIHIALKQFDAKGKEFLAYLTDLSKNGPEPSVYKDNLDDAIESTNDAMKTVEKATKEIAPPPVRRKQ
jgi:hypothetical protein